MKCKCHTIEEEGYREGKKMKTLDIISLIAKVIWIPCVFLTFVVAILVAGYIAMGAGWEVPFRWVVISGAVFHTIDKIACYMK